jgi:uncharacterized protein YkwD
MSVALRGSVVCLLAALTSCLPALRPQEAAVEGESSAPAGDERAPALVFDTRAEPKPVRGDYDASLELERVSLAVANARAPSLVGDGRLGDVALSLARSLKPQERALDLTTLAPLTRARGLVNPLPQVTYVLAPTLEHARQELIDKGVPLAVQFGCTHYGLAATRRGRAWMAVLVVDRRPVELSPVPLTLAAAGEVTVQATLLEGLTEPTLVVTRPDGTSATMASNKRGAELTHTLSLSDGVWGIEVMGTGEHGPSVVANLTVEVGKVAPSVRPASEDTGSAPSTAEGFVGALQALVEAERTQQGAAALERFAELDAVALGHSTDMRDNHFFGHVSSTTGGPAERVLRAQVPIWAVRENVARGYTPREVHSSLMASPAHRANVVATDVDKLGLGVALEYEGGRPVFYVTELFGQSPHPIEPNQALELAAKRISELRSERGLSPVIPDVRLSAAAQQAAQRFFDEPAADEQALLKGALKNARMPKAAQQAAVRLFLGLAPAALVPTDEMFDPAMRWIGVGVAQGSHPRTGPAGIAVVTILAK